MVKILTFFIPGLAPGRAGGLQVRRDEHHWLPAGRPHPGLDRRHRRGVGQGAREVARTHHGAREELDPGII